MGERPREEHCFSADSEAVARLGWLEFNDPKEWTNSLRCLKEVFPMSMDSDQPPRKKVKHYDNGEPHFLTFSCYRRMPLLSKDRTRQWFVEVLDQARAVHGFQLWAWVIMPEHVHVLLWPPFHSIASDPRSKRGRISGILSSIKRPVGEKAVSYLSEHSPDFLQQLTVTNATRTYHRF